MGPKASRWTRSRRWSASSPNQFEQVLLPNHQRCQLVEFGRRGCPKGIRQQIRSPSYRLPAHQIYKVLAKGKMPDQPVIVKARFFSKQAEEKSRLPAAFASSPLNCSIVFRSIVFLKRFIL